MKYILFLSVLLALTPSSSTLGQDSLVYMSEVSFASAFEKNTFADLIVRKRPDYFKLFMANGSLLRESQIDSHESAFGAFLQGLNLSKYEGKKNDKKIKFIYESIQDRYFKKYQADAKFEAIFNSGQFDGTSASALFALTLENFNIPYDIKERPDKVYVMAYPGTDNIPLEVSTNNALWFEPSAEFRESFLENLKNQKIISASEYASQDKTALFEKHYYGEQGMLTLSALAGLMYMKDAIQLSQSQQFMPAFQQFEKAYLLCPTERMAYLAMISGSEAFQQLTQKDLKHATLLGKLSRYSNFNITDDMIAGEFYGAVQELLFNKSDKQGLDAYYKELLARVNRPSTVNEINYIYNFENGRSLYNRANYSQAIGFFEEALRCKPKNQDIQALFINCLIQIHQGKAVTVEGIALIEKYGTDYPDLLANNLFNSIQASLYLVKFGMDFNDNKIASGEKYKQLFEAHMDKYPDVTLDQGVIGQAYSHAAVYYFRKGQTAKAKTLITKGLQYAPNSGELRARQQMIR